MTHELPAWTPFDPDAPPELSPNGGAPGRVVALVAGDAAMKGGWVGEVTLGLAASWGVSSNGRVVAADAAFREPCLHRAADLPLDEGLSDMLLWGGSLQRVARATERVGFVVTAGTPIVDGAAALVSSRWAEVCQGFREAGVTLVVLVPAAEAGLAAVVQEASDVVLLVSPEEAADAILEHGQEKVRATVGMLVSADAPAEAPAGAATGSGGTITDVPLTPGAPEPTAHAPSEALEEALEDGRAEATTRGAAATPGAAEPPAEKGAFEAALRDAIEEGDALEDADDPLYRVSEEPESPEMPVRPVPAPTPAPRGGGRIVTLTVLLVVLVLAVLVAALMGIVNIPGITKSGEAAVGSTAVLVPAADAPLQAYSVEVGTYDDAGTAVAHASDLASVLPDVVFLTEPIAEAGLVRHRVLAGPATDATAAGDLVGRLTAALGADLGEARPVATPRAFKLGEMRELAAAVRRVEVLAGLDIPAYVLAVDYEDGSVRYRVYAGAYAEESEGVGLARLLQERGLAASALTERIGRLPGSDS